MKSKATAPVAKPAFLSLFFSIKTLILPNLGENNSAARSSVADAITSNNATFPSIAISGKLIVFHPVKRYSFYNNFVDILTLF
jgi:hypothetical protein